MSALGERLVEAVKIRPNERGIIELRAHHEALAATANTERQMLTAGALKWLIEMWDRITDAEKAR